MMMHAISETARRAAQHTSSLVASQVRNIWCARSLTPFGEVRFKNFVIAPFDPAQLDAVSRLYTDLNGGASLGLQRRLILRLLGSRLCLVVRHESESDIIGMLFFYFNATDRIERTVHEGYIGLREAARGGGLGTCMRRHAMTHFARSYLTGVTSRISAANFASLKSNENLGFVRTSSYFDEDMGEHRYYLKCDLHPYKDSGYQFHQRDQRVPE